MSQQNIEMGPCRVSMDGVEIGPTVGAVRLSVELIWRDRRSERFGASVVDRVLLGARAGVTLRLREKSYEALHRALPGALLSAHALGIGRPPGFASASAACLLRLHPEERPDEGRDVLLHRAVAEGALEIEYGPGRERVIEIAFTALVDPTAPEGEWIARLEQQD